MPGLFEGDEHTTLMTQCKEGAQREGLMLDSNEELYKWFTHQVIGLDINQCVGIRCSVMDEWRRDRVRSMQFKRAYKAKGGTYARL